MRAAAEPKQLELGQNYRKYTVSHLIRSSQIRKYIYIAKLVQKRWWITNGWILPINEVPLGGESAINGFARLVKK